LLDADVVIDGSQTPSAMMQDLLARVNFD
jgi:hypothetical protein